MPPNEIFSLLRRWDDSLAASGLSERTRRTYRYYLIRFAADTLIPLAGVTEDDAASYLAGIAARGRDRSQALRALRSFYGWAHRRGVVDSNPVAFVKAKRTKYPPVIALEPEEIRSLVIAAALRHPKRAWAILLLLETGARVGSAAGIRTEDAPEETGKLLPFLVAKGDRRYSVPLSPLAAEAIRELKATANGTLLGVKSRTIWSWVHQAALDAGLPPGKRHPHRLRHTFGTLVYRRVKDPRLVQELMGHADLSQIPRYVAVDDEQKREALAEPLL